MAAVAGDRDRLVPRRTRRLAAEVESTWGKIDIWVNNAAQVLVRPFLELSTEDWHREHDLGVDIRDSCERLAREHPRYRDMIMVWADRGEEMAAGQFDQTVDVLSDLKAAGVPCYALSNMEPDCYAIRRERFPFMKWFTASTDGDLHEVKQLTFPNLKVKK